MRVLRWVLVLPSALLGSWLAWLISDFLVRLSLARGVGGLLNNESFIYRFYLESLSHAAMGVAFIYVGSKVAPAQRLNVSYILSVLMFVLGGFLIFPAIMVGDGWAIWGAICMILGVSAVVYSIHNGGTDISQN